MKDKELRKLLRAKGITEKDGIEWTSSNEPFGFKAKSVYDLVDRISELGDHSERHSDNDSKLFQSNSELRGKLKILEDLVHHIIM